MSNFWDVYWRIIHWWYSTLKILPPTLTWNSKKYDPFFTGDSIIHFQLPCIRFRWCIPNYIRPKSWESKATPTPNKVVVKGSWWASWSLNKTVFLGVLGGIGGWGTLDDPKIAFVAFLPSHCGQTFSFRCCCFHCVTLQAMREGHGHLESIPNGAVKWWMGISCYVYIRDKHITLCVYVSYACWCACAYLYA